MNATEAMCLLEYYAIPRDQRKYNRAHNIESLLDEGLLEDNEKEGYMTITSKGMVHVDNMLNTPMPVQVWVLPTGDELEEY